MWRHARLLRRAVLTVSLLTLSGLHQQQERPSAGWRAARLLPLSLGAAYAAGSVAYTVTTHSAFSLLYSLVMSVLILYNLSVMAYLLRHRTEVHTLLRHVARLETVTAVWRRRGDYDFLKWQCFLLVGIQVLAAAIWTTTFFLLGKFEHPHYLVPVLVPPALHCPAGFWAGGGAAGAHQQLPVRLLGAV